MRKEHKLLAVALAAVMAAGCGADMMAPQPEKTKTVNLPPRIRGEEGDGPVGVNKCAIYHTAYFCEYE